MDVEKQIGLIMTFSVFFYSVISLRFRLFSKNTIIVVSFSVLISLFPGKYNAVHSINNSFLVFPFALMVGIVFLFQKEILPKVNERVIHIISMIYIYSLFLNLGFMNHEIVDVILLIPVIPVVYSAVVLKKIKKKNKLILYCINIFMLTFIEFFNLKRIVTHDLPEERILNLKFSNVISIFFITGIMFYIIIYLSVLLKALPLPGKAENSIEVNKRISQYKDLFSRKLSSNQANPLTTIVITIGILVFYFYNYMTGYIPDYYITDVAPAFFTGAFIKVERKFEKIKNESGKFLKNFF